jgi:protein-S-isoprenylcysteine O-methyltransferase Ste14
LSNTEHGKPARPDIHVAPPLIFAAGFIAGYLMHRLVVPIYLVEPRRNVRDEVMRRLGRLASETPSPRPLIIAAVILIVLGVAVAVWGAMTFRIAKTSVLPFRPASAMVTKGPYRFTRNPMYIGMTLGYVGLSLALNTGWPLIALPFVLLALVRVVISREEAYLEQTFGAQYVAFKSRVRRWL